MALSKRNLAFAGSLYVALVLLFFVFDRIESSLYGLKYQVKVAGDLQSEGISRQPDLDCLRLPSPPPNHLDVNWTGVWYTPATRLYAIRAGADDRVELWIDGNLAVMQDTKSAKGIATRFIPLSRGFHQVETRFSQIGGGMFLTMQMDHFHFIMDLLNPPALFPEQPSMLHLWIARTASFLRALLLFWATAVPLQCLILFLCGRLRGISDPEFTRRALIRTIRILVPASIILYGGLLRFEALTIKHGEVTNPAFVAALQNHAESLHVLHPDTLHWTEGSNPYDKGDPINYLRMARAMKSFYAAQFREPFYVFVVKQSLRIFGPDDIAVSFASGFFSILAIFITFLLGSYTFSWWTGVLASIGMAVDQELVSIGVDGWRDDTFMFLVLLFTYAAVRMFKKASFGNALFAGIVAGIVCLTRLTSFSFIVPAYAYLLFATRETTWKVRLKSVALSVFLFVAVITPFLINCALVYGDPLFSVNDNTKFYRSRENVPESQTPKTVAVYLTERLLDRPWKFIDTGIVGLTRYPFLNKWKGFNYLSPDLPPLFKILSVLGCILLLFSSLGRLVLLMNITVLIPYAFTYEIRGGWEWRFTMPAYPFYMIAAALSIVVLSNLIWNGRASALLPNRRLSARSMFFGAAIIASISLSGWLAFIELNLWRKAEAMRSGEAIQVESGDRDSRFVGSGWYLPVKIQEQNVRINSSRDSVLIVPMNGKREYNLALGLTSAFLKPQTNSLVHVLLNDQPVGDIQLEEGDSIYRLSIPPDVVEEDENRITIRTDGNESGSIALAYWKLWAIEAFQRGVEKFRNNEIDAAIEYFQQAVQEARNRNAGPYYYLGECYLKKGDGPKAVDNLSQALNLSRGNPAILQARAEAYMLTKQYPQAIEDLNRVLSKRPDDETAKQLLSTAQQENDLTTKAPRNE